MPEALRLLFMTGRDGQPASEVFAGDGASLYLGHPGLRAGDTVMVFDVPRPVWTEHRASLLTVRTVMRSTSEVAYAEAYADPHSPGKGLRPAVGHRARVLRDRVVVADGLTIGHCPERRAADQVMRFIARSGGTRTGLTVFDIGLAFPDLRARDQIEVYQVVPADGQRHSG
ncbi:hypothetical protein [Actinomadura mexicana]|uniref:Uncharacterized protein n=1 Tax=Actinomadura mexicana TaxID=134959 RepID=A0A238VWD1_9ACTN|nr:hypothetical protein [Actinomadura mexicana]SNR38642.1 hypothetical protein SAMN06265355_102466 [Actinomadura mexicana]